MKTYRVILIFVLSVICVFQYEALTRKNEVTLNTTKIVNNHQISQNQIHEVVVLGEPEPEAPSSTPPFNHNLVANGSFANNLDSWSHSDGIKWSDGAGINYTGALMVATNLEANASQCIPVSSATTFSVIANFQYANEIDENTFQATNEIYVYSYNKTSCDGPASSIAILSPNPKKSGWQHLQRGGLIGSDSLSVKIEIYQPGNAVLTNNGVWDDIYFSLTPTNNPKSFVTSVREKANRPTGENYLKNPRVDLGSESWGLLKTETPDADTQWVTSADSGGGKIVSYEKLNMYGPTSSITRSILYQCINLGEHKFYQFGAKMLLTKRSNLPGDVRVGLSWSKTLDCRGPMEKTESNLTFPQRKARWWEATSEKILATDTALSVRLSLLQTVKKPSKIVAFDEGIFELEWDDFYFKGVE